MFTKQDNLVFDQILSARRICRKFNGEVPAREEIEAVVEAGRLAPYASISAGDVDVFRHFFVMTKGHPLLPEIDRLIRQQSAADVEWLRGEKEKEPFLVEYGVGLENLWSNVAANGLPVFPEPPCLIVLAEWRGARRAERQSLAHTIQNMWLKATALNLDFNLISPLESMVDNEEFCSLFGLPVGRYGFHGCVLGHRDAEKLTSKPITAQVHWL